jgi:hypothetical protein
MSLNRGAALAATSLSGNVRPLWAAPDMSIVNSGRRSPPAMPTAMFGHVWPLLGDMAHGAGAPVDYVALGYLAVAASLIGGKRRVQPYREADWSEPAIIWAGVVGDPSSNKSPALDRVINPLRELEREHADEHRANLNGWQGECERAKADRANWQALVKQAAADNLATPAMPESANEPSPPQRRRLVVQDSTPEKLAEILSGNPSGTCHYRDELVGWLTSFDRYTAGGREFWIEAYGGRPHVIDRKGSPEPILIPFNGVSVCGGIQPERLADALFGRTAPDDGLVARFIWAWPDRPAYCRPRRGADKAAMLAIYSRLNGLGWSYDRVGSKTATTLPLTDGAADLFEMFERDNRDAGDEAAGLMKSFCGKLPGLLLRLALVSELAQWAYTGAGEEPTSISAETIAATAEFVESYARPSAARVYGDAAVPAADRHAGTIAKHILKMKAQRVNARLLRRESGLGLPREAQAVDEALARLVDADWLQPDGHRDGDTPGRQSKDFSVNPMVHGGGE